MKSLLYALILLAGGVRCWSTPQPTLHTNLTQALAAARMEQKLVLLNFTSPASAWCQACKHLDLEVCRAADFRDYTTTNFVLMVLDELQVSSADGAETVKALEEKYTISSWPTLIVLDAKGSPLGRVAGYSRGTGCAKIITELDKIRLRN